MPAADTGLSRARRKATLLQAAAELFAARGYHAVTTDQLGQAVGISGPALYRHFGSKSDILLQICNHAMDHLLAGAPDVVASARSDSDALARLTEFHAEFAVRTRAGLAVYLGEQHALPAPQLRALKKRQRDYERIWITAIRGATSLPEADSRAAAKLLLSLLNGTAYLRDGLAANRVTQLLTQLGRGALLALQEDAPRPLTEDDVRTR
jgi:AcrR family transcriptional regulator